MAWRGHRPESCLIGNSSMHFGNLSLLVAQIAVGQARFMVAPVYDMRPMRWRPDAATGALNLLPFRLESIDRQSPACAVAEVFWHCAATHAALSQGFRALARTMAERMTVDGV